MDNCFYKTKEIFSVSTFYITTCRSTVQSSNHIEVKTMTFGTALGAFKCSLPGSASVISGTSRYKQLYFDKAIIG